MFTNDEKIELLKYAAARWGVTYQDVAQGVIQEMTKEAAGVPDFAPFLSPEAKAQWQSESAPAAARRAAADLLGVDDPRALAAEASRAEAINYPAGKALGAALPDILAKIKGGAEYAAGFGSGAKDSILAGLKGLPAGIRDMFPDEQPGANMASAYRKIEPLREWLNSTFTPEKNRKRYADAGYMAETIPEASGMAGVTPEQIEAIRAIAPGVALGGAFGAGALTLNKVRNARFAAEAAAAAAKAKPAGGTLAKLLARFA